MNQMSNYNYASLSKEQQDILKRAEDEINIKSDNTVLVMAFKGDKE